MMDETTMKVMDKDKKGTTHRGYFWAAQAPPAKLVFFEYQPGRNQQVPQALLSDYKGYLRSDGYSSCETLAANKDITLNEKSAIHKAFAYTMKRYKRLSVYMENGALNIDNNPIEGSIRGIALGRKNFLFCGSHDGAQRSAMLYSFMATCKLLSINPMVWMVDVLKKINKQPTDQIQDLLPHRWKKLQEIEPVL